MQWSGITASGKPKAQGKATASAGSQRSNFVRTNMKARLRHGWMVGKWACMAEHISMLPTAANLHDILQGGGRFSFKSKSGRGSQKRRGGRFGGRGAK